MLWFIRNWKARSLLILAVLPDLNWQSQNFAFTRSLEIARDAAEEMNISISKGEEVNKETAAWAQAWIEYEDENQLR